MFNEYVTWEEVLQAEMEDKFWEDFWEGIDTQKLGA